MPQVVDASNHIEFVQNGKVPEFKPPGSEAAPPADAPGTPPGKQSEAKAPAQPRDPATQQFTSREAGDKTTTAAAPSDKKGAEKGADPLTDATKAAIDKKHRQMKEAEERERRETLRAIQAERLAESLQRQLEAAQKSGQPSKPQEPPKEPRQEDFTTIGEYTDALVNYRVDQRLREEKTKAEREAEQRESEARAREFGKRIATAREKHEDFTEVLNSIAGTELDRVHADVTEYIQESEQGAELLYHLAKNPDVLDRLRKYSPRKFIAELGKLEAKWESQTTADEKQTQTLTQVATTPPSVSKAPAPIAPIDTAGVAPVTKKPEDMTVAELREFRRGELRNKRAAAR